MPKGVLCLEDTWWNDVSRPNSVEPILTLLSHWSPYHVPYAHRNVESHVVLFEYLKRWRQRRYERYPILHLAFHGCEQRLLIGDRRVRDNEVTLDELEKALAGGCAGRMIHFSGCNVFDAHGRRLRSFLDRTGALAITGFTKDVNWLDSTVFEALLFGSMQENAFTRSGAHAIERNVRRRSGGMAKLLGFRMVVRSS